MRQFIFSLTILLIFATSVFAAKPNVVLIYADDLGYGDVGCYGATLVQTPNIDLLAKEGRRFTDAHSASAVCSPSRYCLLTGRYAFRKNLLGPHSPKRGLCIATERLSLAKMFKEAGYATAIVGKWHLGMGDKTPVDWNAPLKPGPLELGFDYYFGIPQVNSGPPYVLVENHSVLGLDPQDPLKYGGISPTKKYPEKGGKGISGGKAAHALYVDEMLCTNFVEKALKWLGRQKKDQPFFLYFSTTNIHHPFTPHPRFKGTSKCGLYGDFIHELDWAVGELMELVEKRGQTENTIFLFTSDNGGMLNKGGIAAWEAGHRNNGKLLGFKFGIWEGGHRIPYIVRWPAKVPAGTTSDQLVANIDSLATFADILGRNLKEDEGPDSVSVLEAWTGTPQKGGRDHLLITPHKKSHLAVRSGDWIYIPAKGPGGFTRGSKKGYHGFGGGLEANKFTGQKNSDIADGKIRQDAPKAQLYNLKEDPYQTTNVYAKNPEVVERLKKILEKERK